MTLKLIRLFYLHAIAVCILHADYLDDIGLTDLRARDASLDGSGITVAQVEASTSESAIIYQVDPFDKGIGSGTFRYFDSTAPYSEGTSFSSIKESGHANIVGGRFFASTTGVASGVTAIQNFYAGYYYNTALLANDIISNSINTGAKVVNQSFVFGAQSSSVDQNYDDYAAKYNVLFCNGLNTNTNPATIPSPASSYNGIAVGVVNGNSTPLSDGRSKPDIVAPGSSAASFTTPLVSGAATLLIQSGNDSDAGSGTESDATDICTIKALLLNAATKPSGWSHTSTRPLDIINGAGVLEINQAQLQLAAGKYAPTQDEVLTEAGTAHAPPSGETGNLASNVGWNLGSVANTSVSTPPPKPQNVFYDATDHYFFDLNSADAAAFYLTSTLVWNRQNGQSSINNLNLFLYEADGTLVAESVSSVDNVEHIYERHLPPGRYVLQVHKPYNDGRITNSETYALAFNFRSAPSPGTPGTLSATTASSSEIDLSWTDTSDDETGYRVKRRPSGGTYSTIATLATDSTAYSDSGLAPGTTYEYQVIAFNAEAESSATASATTLIAVPDAPSDASATTISASAIDLAWTDNSASETGYRIERRLSGGSYSLVTTAAADTEFYDDKGLAADTGYDYRITAYNGAGDSTSIETSGRTYSLIEDWRLTYFGTTANSGDAADDFDYDLDSIANLIEYATGSNPTTFSPNPLDTSLLGSDGQVSFDWRVGSGYGFSLGYSSDLTTDFSYYDSATLDSDLSPELELIDSSTPVNGFETRTYGVRDSITEPNVFLRLLVN